MFSSNYNRTQNKFPIHLLKKYVSMYKGTPAVQPVFKGQLYMFIIGERCVKHMYYGQLSQS